MAQLRAHNPEALEVLFDRYSRLVLSIALRILKDQGEAEDAVQDIFLYLYKRAMLFDPSKGPAKAWIARVAFHRALDRKSYLGRRGFYLDVHFDSLEDTLLGATDLEREIGSKLNHAALEQAFTELPDAQRRTLAMFYFEGLDLREIAGKLNEPLGNVRHFYYRGLQRLRKSAYIGKLQKD
jgi:RNA polymerase sigma-70 factor (ECF subfamily)